MQLNLLWNYQQADIEVEKFESEMRNDSDRQTLLKQRNTWVEQQNLMKKLENDVAIMSDRLDAVRDEAERLEKQLIEQRERFLAIGEVTEENIETVREGIRQIQRTLELISRYETELTKMKKDAELRDRQQREIRIRAAKVKAEFDQLKVEYDKKFQAQRVKLDELKAAAQKEAAGLDPALLEHYRELRKHCFPPMAKLNGDRCSGCNMQLPSVVMRDIRAGSKLVECDNCGRIIFAEE